MPPTGDDMNVAAELAQLRGELGVSLARIEGQLNLLVQAQDTTRADVEALEARVAALEARRVPLGVLGAVSAVVSAAVALLAFLAQA